MPQLQDQTITEIAGRLKVAGATVCGRIKNANLRATGKGWCSTDAGLLAFGLAQPTGRQEARRWLAWRGVKRAVPMPVLTPGARLARQQIHGQRNRDRHCQRPCGAVIPC